MIELTKSNDKLFWLPASGIQELDNNTLLIGQDGWADGRLGDYKNSRVVLNDSRMIADLFQEKILGKYQLLEKMQQLADKDAMRLQEDLVQTISQHPQRVIILTHVPPFRKACMHMGKISRENILFYTNQNPLGLSLDFIGRRIVKKCFISRPFRCFWMF